MTEELKTGQVGRMEEFLSLDQPLAARIVDLISEAVGKYFRGP